MMAAFAFNELNSERKINQADFTSWMSFLSVDLMQEITPKLEDLYQHRLAGKKKRVRYKLLFINNFNNINYPSHGSSMTLHKICENTGFDSITIVSFFGRIQGSETYANPVPTEEILNSFPQTQEDNVLKIYRVDIDIDRHQEIELKCAVSSFWHH